MTDLGAAGQGGVAVHPRESVQGDGPGVRPREPDQPARPAPGGLATAAIVSSGSSAARAQAPFPVDGSVALDRPGKGSRHFLPGRARGLPRSRRSSESGLRSLPSRSSTILR